ncbi:MAG: 50S ribosomal protein L6 [Phycisphaerales bacterium]|nr:50S ribosomal protein L6 [Phycisphaerales bacterium]
MSRIGKTPIQVPAGVTVNADAGARSISVKGPKGELTYTWHEQVDVSVDEGTITTSVKPALEADRKARAQWGTARARIANMVTGVTQGYSKTLNIVGVGWNAKPMGKTLQLNVGYCHPVDLAPPTGVEFAVDNGNKITVSGPDKHLVGQFAANIRSKRLPEPYNGKGIMYEGEQIIRKQGKAFGA